MFIALRELFVPSWAHSYQKKPMRVFCHFRASLAAANCVFSFDFRQKNTSVKDLDLGWNKIGNEGAAAIAKMLEVGS